jgi:MHS family proline/betaine transporter-like MFS transporter
MRKYLKGFYLPAMLGASIEYYDIALYGYMAPILIQVFFPYLDKTTAYFLYFLFEFFAAIFQLAGANFFGFIGDKHGRKPAMYSSIFGMSCVTFLMCMLPTYNQIGILATILFMMMRGLQSFFLGGEYNGGAIYLMEHERDNTKHSIISGLYCAFTVSGIIVASMIAFMCNKMGPEYFRIAYAISFLFAIVTYKMRLSLKETPAYTKHNKDISDTNAPKKIFILKIIIASLFFGALYGLPTRIFNALLPIAIGINSDQIMLLNTSCLILYMGLLVLAGLLANRYGATQVMRSAAITVCITSYPLMIMIQSGYWIYIIAAKIIFTILTATFIGPFHSWAQSMSNAYTRYKSISISYALGKCFSTILLACSFLIYDYIKNIAVLGIILSFIAIITTKIFYEISTKK